MFEQYLKIILPLFDWYKGEKQIYSITGYDVADSLIDGLRDNCFPVVLIQDLPEGNITFEDGFLNSRIVSLWVLEQCKATNTAAQKAAQNRCYDKGIDIIKHIVNDCFDNDFAASFDRKSTPYFPRSYIGQYCFGYEFLLTFRTDIDMSL